MEKNVIVVVVSKEKGYVAYDKVKLEDWKSIDGEYLLAHSFLLDSFRKIMGRTLTLIDSSIVDKGQNKAMKDIVRNIMSDEMQFAAEMCFDQKKIEKMATKSFDEAEKNGEVMETVTIETVLGVNEEEK